MDKLNFLIEFIGSLEPSTWVNERGIKAWLWGPILLVGFVMLRDGIKRGFFSLIRYGLTALTMIFVVFSLL